MIIDINTYSVFVSYCLLKAADKNSLVKRCKITVGRDVSLITGYPNEIFFLFLKNWISGYNDKQLDPRYNVFTDVIYDDFSQKMTVVFDDIDEDIFFDIIDITLRSYKMVPFGITYYADLTNFSFSKERVIEEFVKGKISKYFRGSHDYVDFIFDCATKSFAPVTRDDWHAIIFKACKYGKFLNKLYGGD